MRFIRLRRRIANPAAAALLRSPLHPLLSGSVLLLTYRGRRTGRTYTIPVLYAEDAAGLTIFVARAQTKVWWRSLEHDPRVTLRLRGADYTGIAEAVPDGAELAGAYVARFPRAERAIRSEPDRLFVRVSSLKPAR